MNTQPILPLEIKNNAQINTKDENEYKPSTITNVQYYKSRSNNKYGQNKFKKNKFLQNILLFYLRLLFIIAKFHQSLRANLY